MNSFDLLKRIIHDRLNGDESRLLELFQDEGVLNELIAAESPGDWYRFRKRTYDGEYLVKAGDGYEVYSQDRGQVFEHRVFKNLNDAAAHFFRKTK